MYGWVGKILRVDLSSGKIKEERLQDELLREYIGGNGLVAKILWEELKGGEDPLGPQNKLIFATGPLNGTIWPSSGRLKVAAKSPLSNGWGEGNVGGHLAPYIKYAGYDAVIFEGASERPVYLYIKDEEAELKDASSIWGKDTWLSHKVLEKELGKGIHTALIGQAGENLVRFAAVIVDKYAAAARSGLGAVMGSKKLKAIVVRGTRDVNVYDQEGFYELAIKAHKKLLEYEFSWSLIEYGTPLLVEIMNSIGRFPTKNCQQGAFPYALEISGDVLKQKYRVREESCFSCPFRCKKYHVVERGRWKCDGGLGLEYESLHALGSRVWNRDVESIIYANSLCNKYGMDTDDTGGVIGFVMELWEKGIITKEDTGGIELEWGNSELIVDLVRKIALREGFGDILAEGTHRVAERFGPEAKKYEMTVKGLDIPAQDGRAQKSMGLSHATANRGADHLTSAEFLSEVGFPDAILERFERRAQELYGRSILPEGADRLSPKFKPLMVFDCENLSAVVDSLVICKFTTHWPPVVYFKEIAEALTLATGMKYTEKDVRLIGERIFMLERAFNLREGFSAMDDRLPERFLKEPAPQGPCKGHVVELDEMLKEYYKLRGLDERGYPSIEKMKELGLEEVARQLEVQ